MMKVYLILALVLVILFVYRAFNHYYNNPSLTLENFAQLKLGTSYTEVEKQFGKPSGDIGSGIHIFTYNLNDGSEVLLGFADLNSLMYIKHKLPDGTLEFLKN